MVSRRDILKTILTFVPVPLLGKSLDKISREMNVTEKPMLRFAVASDGHYGQSETPFEMYYENIVKWLHNESEQNRLDFIIFNGDIIHDEPDYLDVVKSYFNRLKVPYFPVQGNHDMVTAVQWKNAWGIDVNHSFDMKNSAFVLMTTSNENGEYLCGDVDWLSNELHKYHNKKHVFIFLHISQKEWTKHGIECPDLINVLNNARNISAVFHGHDHHEDDVKYHQGIPYLWSGHFGGSWGQEYKGFRIVEVFNDNIKTFMKNPLGRSEFYKVWI